MINRDFSIINCSITFLYNADFGCSKYTLSNFPSSLHNFSNCIVILFTLWDCEDCFMPWWIKFLSLWIELCDSILLQSRVHIILCHLHTLKNLNKVIFDCLYICGINFDLLDKILSTLNIISNIDNIFCKLCDGVFSSLVNLLFVSLDCIIVFCQLID